MVKTLSSMQNTWVQSLGREDLLEKGMGAYSNILAWEIPWIEEPGGLQSMESKRVGHDRVTFTSLPSLYISLLLFLGFVCPIRLPGSIQG